MNQDGQIKGEEMAGHVARIGEMRNEYKVPVTKFEGKRPLRRHRHTWEDSIRMYLRETGWEGVDLDSSGSG
jgi:hypothetical protein